LSSLGALNSLRALGSLGALGSDASSCRRRTLRALGARDPLRALGPGGALRANIALEALRSLGPLGALCPGCCPCGTLRTLGALLTGTALSALAAGCSRCPLGSCRALSSLRACLSLEAELSGDSLRTLRAAAALSAAVALSDAVALSADRTLKAYRALRACAQAGPQSTCRPPAAWRALRTLRSLRARTAVHRDWLPKALSTDLGKRAEPAPALWPKGAADGLIAPFGTLRAREEEYHARHAGALGGRLLRFRGRRYEQCGCGEQGGGAREFGGTVGTRRPGARIPGTRVLAPVPFPHPVRDPRRVRIRIAPLTPSVARVSGS